MKICFVGLQNLPVLAPEFEHLTHGGEELQQTLLARAFARRGAEVCMVTGDFGQPDHANWNGITVFKCYGPDEGVRMLRFVHPRVTGLWNAFKRADADVYYTSCAGYHVGVLAAFCRVHRRRLVFRLAHDCDCEYAHPQIRYGRDRLLYREGLKRADVILAQTDFQRRRMAETLGLPTTLAGMLVDPPDAIRPFPERDIDVLWVSNMGTLKRPELALDLAAMLPGLNVHMVGAAQEGHEDLEARVVERAALLPNLVLHGRIPYRQVGSTFDRARVLISTSSSEGFPNTFLQAWIRGVPVISFFDPDGVIRQEGLGVPVETLDEMRDAILRLASNATAWERMSDTCRAFMARHFDDTDVLAPYLDAAMAA